METGNQTIEEEDGEKDTGDEEIEAKKHRLNTMDTDKMYGFPKHCFLSRLLYVH